MSLTALSHRVGACRIDERNHSALPGVSAKQRLLLGVWKLLDSYEEYTDGTITRSEGKPIGMLVYEPSGHMIVQVMRVDPDCVESAYFGTFEVDEQKRCVLHRMEGSMAPAESGLTRERSYDISGDRLSLTTPPVKVGERMRIRHIVWMRWAAVEVPEQLQSHQAGLNAQRPHVEASVELMGFSEPGHESMAELPGKSNQRPK